MSDMRATIIPKSNQLNFDDLLGGQTKTIKITGVSIVKGEQPASISYEGDEGKPYKPCKSMCRVLVQLWGINASAYIGRSLTLYGDPKVRFGGKEVGGLRISHVSGIPEPVTLKLTASRAQKSDYTVHPLNTNDPPTPEDKATQEAFDVLLQEAYGATTLEGINEIAKKAGKNKGVLKAKLDEMREIVTKKRAEFQRQPGEDG